MVFAVYRPFRRLINKNFGFSGCKQFFIVLASVALLLYTFKVLFVTDERQVWEVKNVPINKSNQCEVKCLPEQFSFYIHSGEKTPETGSGPVICFQGNQYMGPELKNVGRGLNVVLVDSKTQTVKSTSVFDTYVDESSLLRFLKKDVKDDDIILLATFDDASYNLKESARHWLKLYGSSLATKVGFRDNFIMIGHRALAEGSAIEYHRGRTKDKEDSFAQAIEKAGCFSVPLGKRISMENTVPEVLRGDQIKVGGRYENCGLPKPCPVDTVAVSVDTGQGNVRKPSICVNGFIQMDGSTNDAGRGFNVVVLEQNTLKTIKVTHMDTYTFDSTDLELFLEALAPNDIIIAVIADDASKKLGQSARDSLNFMGSGMIQNLRFRDVWYFVGQKGMTGFSTMEQLSFAFFDNGWPKPLISQFCIPKVLPTSKIMIEPEMTRNDRRREFCTKYEGYTDFCNPAHVDDEFYPIGVAKKELKNHKIFDTPLIIVPGMNHNAFAHTLQTTLMQPGINVDMVSVMWDEKMPEYGELADLFTFRNYSLDSSSSYSEQLVKAMKFARLAYPSADHMMIIEEDLLLSPDFMPFMAHCLSVITSDLTLAGAFAWNINGFDQLSGNSSLVYRVQEFPGLGFLLRSKILDKLVDSFGSCCKARAWLGWTLESTGLEMLMPDISRVYRTPFYGAEATTSTARNLFLKQRKTYLETQPSSLDMKHLILKEYEEFLQLQIATAEVMLPPVLIPCVLGKAEPPSLASSKEVPVLIFYHQKITNDYETLVRICRCFGLVALDNVQPKNMHNGLLRFYYQKRDMFLVGTKSPYFNKMTSPTHIISPENLVETSTSSKSSKKLKQVVEEVS